MSEAVLPQQPTAANAEVLSVEWLFEPLWPGERLVARKTSDGVDLTDEQGDRAGPELREAAELLCDAIRVDRAVVDGVWTDMPLSAEDESRRAFIAVDLIELDGEALHDVPYQERRRLLESVIDQDQRVRLGPVVKHPLAGWLSGWQANGFTHYLAKHMNSRYLPGERNDDWLKLALRAEAPDGLVRRLVGGRGRRVRIIRD